MSSNLVVALLGLCFIAVLTNAQNNQRPSARPPLRPTQDACTRRGLCPYVKKLVPDLHSHPAMLHYNPHVHGSDPPSLCGNICTSDLQCPLHQKCCPTNCGYACFDAVHVAHHSKFQHHSYSEYHDDSEYHHDKKTP